MTHISNTLETTHRRDWVGALAELPPLLGIIILIAL